MLILFKLSV